MSRQYPESLMWAIDAHRDDDASDGAWWCMLLDAVNFYNEEHGTSYDDHEAVHAYLRWEKQIAEGKRR